MPNMLVRNFLRCVSILFLVGLSLSAEAQVICMKNSQQFSVGGLRGRRVNVKTPSLFTTAPARCPIGYTALATIPSGELTADSYTGAWSLSGAAGQTSASASLAFPKTLAADPTQVIFVAAGGTNSTCTGTAENPTAPPGTLCVYEGFPLNMSSTFSARYLSFNPAKSGEAGASKFGALIFGYPSSSTLAYYAWGTWAVSQP